MEANQPKRKRVFLGSAGIVMLLIAIGALLVALNIVNGVNTVIPGRQSANIPITSAAARPRKPKRLAWPRRSPLCGSPH
jgi:hypothetical protein